MANKRYAICVGLDHVDITHYGVQHPMSTGKNTSYYFKDLFEKLNFQQVKWMPNEKAIVDDTLTETGFINTLIKWSKVLDDDDLLVISFTGHGSKVKHKSSEKIDLDDEGWCFFDRVLFFLEVWELLRLFRAGVKIIVLSDSCFSGITAVDPVDRALTVQGDNYIARNIEDYEHVFSVQSRPMQWQVPPTIAIISSASEQGTARECTGKVRMTVFGWAIRDTIETAKSLDHKLNALELFEGMQRRLTNIKPECGNHAPMHPRWHYLQGHKFTALARRKQIFEF